EYSVITCKYTAPVAGSKSAWQEQSYRYPIATWTEGQAKSHCSRHGGRFEPAKKPVEKSDLPPGEFVAKRQIIRSQNGSAILIKTEGNLNYPIIEGKKKSNLDYPIIRGGKINKRGLEDYEYLLHHAHLEGESEERLDHCLLFDHLGNAFELEHLEKDGEIYHIIKGLEPSQNVSWSDEQAREEGISPKKMKKGMSFPEKADEW
ncbi:unnamed protein product, partial [marine sediment metagenome]